MSESNDTSNKTLGVPSGKKTLSIKRSVEQGTVRQSFSHGRSKAVVVEKKRRRISKPGETPEATVAEAPKVALKPRPEIKVTEPAPAPKPIDSPKPGMVLKTLTSGEQDARRQALADARVRETEERERAIERARIEAENAASLAVEQQESEQRREAEDNRRKKEEEAKRKAEREAQERLGEPEPARANTGAAPRGGRTLSLEEASREAQRLKRAKPNESRPPRGGDERRRGKLTVTTAFEEDSDRGRSLAAVRRKREREKRALQEQGPREKKAREVIIPETITIQELANRMAERGVEIIKYLMKEGQMLKITDVIDADTAQLIAEEMGHTVRRVSESDVEEGLFEVIVDENATDPRPPVVTIMGHVDHGKTSLLDALREANVVGGEAGGITQHIGAYQVTHNDNLITFIDTPGHAAFTAMRARGARVTDIVILVVAADDGVMPQTIEAINHAKAADVPIIVAINKMDKENADPNRVRTELLQHEIVVEAMSGEVQDIEVSAINKQGLDNLLEAINLQAEILELKADPERSAQGVVIEAKLDKGRGPVGTVLVQTGTLRRGDIVVAGAAWAKVRALISATGEQLDQADPSTPVEVLGFSDAPEAGDAFAVVESEAKAREITEYRTRAARQEAAARGIGARGSLEQMMSRLQEGERSEFPLIIKSDVQGSGEAIIGALDNLGTDEVGARLILTGVGGITESDVTLATASGAAIIGFNVRANKQARDLAEAEGIEIRYYNIIYNLIDDVKAAMSGMLSPERRETFLGNAEILEIFNVSKVGKIAGCRVTEGLVERGAAVRLIRDSVVIHEGELSQLKRFKDDANTVNAGQECGMAFANYQDMRSGDVIECFRVEEVARTL